MSWDASIDCNSCGHVRSWNYTSNCDEMINLALKASGYQADEGWRKTLNGMSGHRGADLLDHAIGGLLVDPTFYRQMNPPNGWGDYDSLVELLIEMRDAVGDNPGRWVID